MLRSIDCWENSTQSFVKCEINTQFIATLVPYRPWGHADILIEAVGVDFDEWTTITINGGQTLYTKGSIREVKAKLGIAADFLGMK